LNTREHAQQCRLRQVFCSYCGCTLAATMLHAHEAACPKRPRRAGDVTDRVPRRACSIEVKPRAASLRQNRASSRGSSRASSRASGACSARCSRSGSTTSLGSRSRQPRKAMSRSSSRTSTGSGMCSEDAASTRLRYRRKTQLVNRHKRERRLDLSDGLLSNQKHVRFRDDPTLSRHRTVLQGALQQLSLFLISVHPV